MDILAKIAVNKAIQANKELAMKLHLKLGSKELETAVNEFADKAGLSPVFITNYLGLIRHWI